MKKVSVAQDKRRLTNGVDTEFHPTLSLLSTFIISLFHLSSPVAALSLVGFLHVEWLQHVFIIILGDTRPELEEIVGGPLAEWHLMECPHWGPTQDWVVVPKHCHYSSVALIFINVSCTSIKIFFISFK